jgi:4-hydroxybenzoate polyprenyltransferase
VDLDGTVVLSDTLFETFACLLRTKPLQVLLIPLWILQGRAYLKRQLALRALPDPSLLPYNYALLEFVARERKQGRTAVLVTAADECVARNIATYLNCFDEVLASGSGRNLVGKLKVAAIRERFGDEPFAYIGDSSRDVPVWRSSVEALTAGCSGRARKTLVKCGIEASHIAERRPTSGWDLLKAMRAHQWLKSTLIFVPLVTSHRYDDPRALAQSLLAAASFSLCASGVYLFNDVLDLEADRRHALKKTRPVASGQVNLAMTLVAAPALMVAGVGISWFLPAAFLATILIYISLTSVYSLGAKTIPILDVLLLAALYTLRIYSGGAATEIVISPWLLGFSGFIFLSLALVKRFCELALQPGTVNSRRGYVPEDAGMLMSMGIASSFAAALVFALYISSADVHALYREPLYLWWICPIFLYWISRTWLLARRGLVDEDPLVFTLRDRLTWLLGAVSLAPFLLATFGGS